MTESPVGGIPLFGFFRMVVIVLGAFILAIGALERFVGAGTLATTLWRFPGYQMIRENPGAAGVAGGAVILVAFVFPTGGLGVNDKR